MSKVFAFVASGLEGVECLAVVDVLRRSGVDTELVSVMSQKTLPALTESTFRQTFFLKR